jgi:protein involved in ribonucleotide reduction
MIIVYASMTGNVRRFVSRLPFPSVDIKTIDAVTEPYVLVTYTFNFGGVPQEVTEFLKHPDNVKYLCGVASSGNRNWGALFAKAADTLAQRYNVPILHKFELSGADDDIKHFIGSVNNLVQVSRD